MRKQGVNHILQIFFPKVCPICTQVLDREQEICQDCRKKLKYITEPKCKKCGGKVISTYTNIEIESNGVLKTVTNTPAKKCSKCGHIIVDDITMEKAKQYANDYPANTIDYAMCEAEEIVVIHTLLL